MQLTGSIDCHLRLCSHSLGPSHKRDSNKHSGINALSTRDLLQISLNTARQQTFPFVNITGIYWQTGIQNLAWYISNLVLAYISGALAQ